MNNSSEPGPLDRPDDTSRTAGPLKAMSPGVVDFLFRQLIAGESSDDVQWHREGIALSAQCAGAELARRLSETDLEALTPTELFHYVRAAQRMASWAETLREAALSRYCDASGPQTARAVPESREQLHGHDA
ncbi:hypothetical protein V3C33_06155 [Micrococcaceae bacterium Sec5.7]